MRTGGAAEPGWGDSGDSCRELGLEGFGGEELLGGFEGELPLLDGTGGEAAFEASGGLSSFMNLMADYHWMEMTSVVGNYRC